MALIKNLQKGIKEKETIHKSIDGAYFIVNDTKVGKILQIDTYGSDQRKFPGKTSQSIQFSPEAIEQLKEILRTEF